MRTNSASLEQFDDRIEREKEIYEKCIDKQFVNFFTDNETGGGVFIHLLVNKEAGDYKDVLNVALAFAKLGKDVKILPIIADRETLKYRQKIFTNYPPQLLKNPDIRIDEFYLDIKRPLEIKNITKNANSASSQGAIAVISDCNLNNKMNADILNKRALAIFNNENRENYLFNELYFFTEKKLIKYNRD